MLKILHARLQQYLNQEISDVQVGFRKGKGTRDQITNIHWIIVKAKKFQKNIYFCFIEYAKAFDCVYHNKLWKTLKRDGNTRPSYLSPEKPVYRSRSNRNVRETDWFKRRGGVHQGSILSPYLFNLYAEHIMWNPHEIPCEIPQTGIQIAGRNINKLRCADDTTLMTQREK